MPYFRIDLVDGTSRQARALRVMSDVEYTALESRRDGDWVPEVRVPSKDVAAVYQRLTELNGSWRWVPVNPNRALGQQHYARPARNRGGQEESRCLT